MVPARTASSQPSAMPRASSSSLLRCAHSTADAVRLEGTRGLYGHGALVRGVRCASDRRPLECGGLTPLFLNVRSSAAGPQELESAVKPAHSKGISLAAEPRSFAVRKVAPDDPIAIRKVSPDHPSLM